MQTKTLLLTLLVCVSTGCTSIHFDNGVTQKSNQIAKEQWHHNFALALYEGSQPVELKKNCEGGEWQSVETKLTFVNGLAGSVANVVAPIWYPKTVKTTCANKVAPLILN